MLFVFFTLTRFYNNNNNDKQIINFLLHKKIYGLIQLND